MIGKWRDSTGNLITNSILANALTPGKYYATVSDSLNCTTNSSLYEVVNETIPIPDPIAADQLVFRGAVANVIVENRQPYSYFLYDTIPAMNVIGSNTSGIFQINSVQYDKIFYVQAVKGSCYSNMVPVKINVFDNTKIFLPNAFSPNNDGINDQWKMNLQGSLRLQYLTVFNRWGQEVFKTIRSDFSWDGDNHGKQLPSGTYYWLLSGTDQFNKTVSFKGSVTILK